MKKKILLTLGGITVIGGTILLAFAQVHSIRSGSANSAITPSGLVTAGLSTEIYAPSVPEVTDLAPNIAFVDKVTIIVRHASGIAKGFSFLPIWPIHS